MEWLMWALAAWILVVSVTTGTLVVMAMNGELDEMMKRLERKDGR